ncbi:MAG: CapA family protein [bacterium]|nr:CapA family protein [bacterium]
MRYFLLVFLLAGAWASAFSFKENLSALYERAIAQNFTSARLERLFDAALSRRQGPLTLSFVGDVMLSRYVGKVIDKHKDPTYPFLGIAKDLQSADLAFGNLEGPISDRGTDRGSKYSFRADPKVVEGLKFAGFDVVSLANNHIFDWGPQALVDTAELLGRAGIKPIGAGANSEEANRPAIFRLKNTAVAYLAFTNLYPKSFTAGTSSPGVSRSTAKDMQDAVRKLRGVADVVVTSLHWGEEYRATSTAAQQELARALVDAGADLVIGHHPHVAEEIERYKGGWIVYSLGNFIFDQNFSEETTRGLMVTTKIARGKIQDLYSKTIVISKSFQPSIQDIQQK